jgi:riboflavin kinase/FMN adenylyltransferase
MGRGREGDADYLRKLGEELGFSVTVISPKTVGEVVSSTAIRSALTNGDMARVTRLLGRHFSLHGTVTTGAGRGAGLGFPTANVDVDPRQALPPEGVYATWCYVGGEAHQSMTNVGRNPTFGENERTVEVFLLDFQGDLYGRDLRLDFVQRLRDEKKFDSVEDLKKQIAEDVEQGRAILSAQGVGRR